MAALFVSTAFEIVSTLTMLGFSVVQYLAINRQVTYPLTKSRSRVRLFIILAWTLSLLGGIAPFTVMLVFARHQPCGPSLRRLIRLVVPCGPLSTRSSFRAVLVSCDPCDLGLSRLIRLVVSCGPHSMRSSSHAVLIQCGPLPVRSSFHAILVSVVLSDSSFSTALMRVSASSSSSTSQSSPYAV